MAHSSRAVLWAWSGNGGNANWNTAGNWNLGSVPVSASTTDLNFAGTNNTGTALIPLNQNIATPFLLNNLTFSTGAGSFFLGGGALRFDGGTSNTITQSSSSAQNIANGINAPSTNGSVTLTLAGNGTGVVTMSGVIATGTAQRDYAITKTGASMFVLSGVNTYRGLTTVSSGVLNIQNSFALGGITAGTTVASGAALQLQGGITVGNEALTLNGSGIANDGALRNISGNNSFAGAVTLGSGSEIGSDAGTLTLSGGITNGGFLLTFEGAGDVTASGVISGTGGLTKTGTGTVTLSGGTANTYTGSTTVNDGTLQLNKTSGINAFAGPVTVGDGTGIASSAVLKWLASNEMATTTAVSINSDGRFDLNNFSQTIGTLTMTSGAVTTGTGTLTLGGTVTGNAASVSATINGRLGLGGNRTFTISDGAAVLDMDISAIISGAFTLTKGGSGTMVLSGANTYTGLTTISAGAVNIQNATALGTTGAGTTVAAGAALQIQGGISVGAEPLTLNGSGISGDGALRNISGNNSFAGTITLASAITISADSGTLSLSGGVVNGGFTLTLGGVGNITQTSVISGTGGVTKTGSGTLTLSGANTFLGGTTINGGIVAVSSDANLGNTMSGVTLNAGTLEITTGFSTLIRLFTLGNAASTFQVDAGQTFTVNTAMTGPGTLNKTGSGTMVLGVSNPFSGGTNVTGGILRISVVDSLLTSGAITISGGTFDLQTFTQTAGAVTLSSGSITGTGTGRLTASSFVLQSGTASAILAGGGTVTKNTAGTVTLSGSNIFTGSTTISAGTLQVNTNNALGTAASGTTVANGAVLTLNNVNYSTAEPLTLNGSGIGNGGALANTGTSTFAGPINAATNATINAGGGTLTLTGGLNKNGTTLTIAGGGTVNITNNGITGSAPNSDLVVDGTTVVLNAANSYNGPTTVQNSGTLQLGNSNVLPTSPQTALTVNSNSVFNLASHSDSVASLSGDSSATVRNSVIGSTSTVTINPGSGVTSTFAGVIAGTNVNTQGDIALQKNGAGTLILTGGNSYGGTTTVNGGTLTAAASSGSALKSTSAITVNSGGTLTLGANNQINDTAPMTLAGGTFGVGNFREGTDSTPGLGALTLTASGSQIDFGSGAGAVLTLAGFTPGSFTLTIANWTGTVATMGDDATDRLIFATSQNGNLDSFAFNGYGPGAMEFDLGNGYYEITPVPVPEPSTYITAAFALATIGFQQVRRRRQPSKRA